MRDLSKVDDVKRRIYIYLLTSDEPRSVREIAEALNMAPSTVHYHLKKMVEDGIVKKASRGYTINKLISIEGYIIIHRKIIPRLFVYSLFFLGLTIGSIIEIVLDKNINMDRILLLISSISAFTLLLYESVNAWRKL
ncbi:putative transcriptional regulator, AsnC family [Staphylothermus hellenicus DSM 12710]|uniref:Putative transcriptional regulator, AsnC family n=1 Tax=Staphylothermus hellenicus (strain DSM 12710 / JCM 10830 / BK20S6-10-b1 / P8) TaxID=591019 RepID=D7D805_STAHD|nr:putative transcriptional regulator, AsnC family [Staphylothermus hellenicus DSM 12710]